MHCAAAEFRLAQHFIIGLIKDQQSQSTGLAGISKSESLPFIYTRQQLCKNWPKILQGRSSFNILFVLIINDNPLVKERCLVTHATVGKKQLLSATSTGKKGFFIIKDDCHYFFL